MEDYHDYQDESSQNSTITQQFFENLYQMEKKYSINSTEAELVQLLSAYTDCVAYFQLKQQRISLYFQYKIKDIMHNLNLFSKKPKEIKSNLNTYVLKTMQKQNIHQILGKQQQKVQAANLTIEAMLKAQEEKIEQRRASKRTMCKSQSVTFSFQSLYSSPQKQTNKKTMVTQNKFLFTKQIHSDDEEF